MQPQSRRRGHEALTAALHAWFDAVHKVKWANMAAVKRLYRTASVVSADRIVVNIKGNACRLVTAVDFEKQIVWIKWVGSHAEYGPIDVKTIAYERSKADSK